MVDVSPPALSSGEASDLLEAARDRRSQRYLDRSFLWGQSSLPRVCRCGRVRVNAQQNVQVIKSGDRAHFGNLQLCGSVWACPVCSAKIRHHRAGEVTTILHRNQVGGGSAVLITLTAPHRLTEQLGDTFDDIANAWRWILKNRAWKSLRAVAGIEHLIRALEITHGPENGWHPHLHLAAIGEADLPIDLIEEALFTIWAHAMVRIGRGKPSRKHGIDVRPITNAEGMAEYIAKVEGAAMELTYADRKTARGENRSPMTILRDARTDGDVADARLYRHYERSTKGRRMLTMSRGLKAKYLVEELTDSEIAEAEVGGELQFLIDPSVWIALLRHRGAQHQVLRLVEDHGAEAAQQFIINTTGAAPQ